MNDEQVISDRQTATDGKIEASDACVAFFARKLCLHVRLGRCVQQQSDGDPGCAPPKSASFSAQ